MLGTLHQLITYIDGKTGIIAGDEARAAAVELIARGCAGAIAAHLDRELIHATHRKDKFNAHRLYAALRAAPVTRLHTVQTLSHIDVPWNDVYHDITHRVARTDATAGILHFAHIPGTDLEEIHVSYDGGYWIDPSPARDGQPPEGQTKLPEDIFLAWLMFCRDVWVKTEKQTLTLPNGAEIITQAGMPEGVRQILSRHQRLAA